MDIININNLTYDKFSNFNMTFNKGLFYNVVGNSQSGKTALFNLILDSNKCKNITILDSYNKISFVNDDLVFFMDKVVDEIKFYLNNNYLNNKYIYKLLDIFKLEDKKINDLTISEKQKLLFLIATINKIDILLIDEAFYNLDSNDKLLVLDYIRSLNITIINFTKFLDIKCDYIYILDNYSIVYSDNYDNIINDDQLFYSRGIKIPFMVDLSIKLKMYNLVDHIYYDMEELVNDLCK